MRNKMATDWSSLPPIILVDILSYFELSERLLVTTTCTKWRESLWYPTLWKNISLNVKLLNRETPKISEFCLRFVKGINLELNTRNKHLVRECVGIFDCLPTNRSIESLSLQPCSFRIDWPERMKVHGLERMLKSLEHMICNAKQLKTLQLGCLSDLTDRSDLLLPLLANRQSAHLEVLHICSVKEDPDSYGLIRFPEKCFSQLKNLHKLGIDYDYLTNELLLSFCNNGRRVELTNLIIHVHGMEPDREKIIDLTWRHVVNANPSLGVTLNLIHSIDGAANLLDILQPSMPLEKLRMFFCQGQELNTPAIDFIALHMCNTFTSLHIVEGLTLGEEGHMSYHLPTENCFVMLAWKCIKLEELVLIGYYIERNDIIAISRLRNKSLQKLQIPACCVTEPLEYNDGSFDFRVAAFDDDLNTEVSTNIGKTWAPMDDSELPRCVFDIEADCEDAYIDILLADQR